MEARGEAEVAAAVVPGAPVDACAGVDAGADVVAGAAVAAGGAAEVEAAVVDAWLDGWKKLEAGALPVEDDEGIDAVGAVTVLVLELAVEGGGSPKSPVDFAPAMSLVAGAVADVAGAGVGVDAADGKLKKGFWGCCCDCCD